MSELVARVKNLSCWCPLESGGGTHTTRRSACRQTHDEPVLGENHTGRHDSERQSPEPSVISKKKFLQIVFTQDSNGSLLSLPSSRRKSYFRSYLHKTAASVLAGKHPRPCSGFKRCSSVRRRRRLFPRLPIFTPQTASLRSRPNLLHPSASPSSDL